jgi:hypothetical protein
MSTQREPADGEIAADGLDAPTRNEIINHAEALTAVDGPLVGDGDEERAEDLIGRMFEAIGGSRLSYAEADADDLVVEADGDDTHWRKQTELPVLRVECGPVLINDEGHNGVDIDNAHLEVLPNGQDRGLVTIDTQIEAEYQGVTHEQGALHQLTPRQARSFAAALLEQAEYVENQQTEP